MPTNYFDPSADPDGLRGLSVDDFARRMSIGRTLAFDLVRRGEIRTVTIGRRRIVPSSEIARLLSADVED